MVRAARAPLSESTERDEEADRVFIEQMAMLLELHSRFPRTAGRIYALLLISDKTDLSQQELADALSVSLASVSTMTRRLVDAGLIERVALPGVRRDHYRLRTASWRSIVHGAVMVAQSFVEQAERGLALPGPDIGPGRQHLEQVRDLYTNLAIWLERAGTGEVSR